jgi:RNA polymerase-binding transcription factor DksA
MSEKAVKTRYTDSELEEFELLIEGKLSEAKKQLDFYVQQLSDSSNNADSKSKGLDDSIGSVENEQISTLASRLRKHIQHLENAKLRIQNKVYGICRVTGKLISKERLKAVPHATLSIEAKNKR